MQSRGKCPTIHQLQVEKHPDLATLRASGEGDLAAGVDDRLVAILGQLFRKVDEIGDILAGKSKTHYSVDEVAEMTGRSAYTIRRWIGEGRLAATRIEGSGPRGRLLIARDQVQRLVTSGLAGEVPAALID